MSYERFAYVYDELMKDAPYEKWLELLLAKMNQYGCDGQKVLDLACGTGEFTIELAKLGYQVAGVDLSEEMLAIAHEKADLLGRSIAFYQQDMAQLEGLGVYDCVTLFCDSLNYLRDEADVQKTFDSVHAHLKQDGLFLFDIHSIYKIEQVFQNQTFAISDEDVSYIWECYAGVEPYSVEHDLSFFVRDPENGLYDRFDEYHYQRTYPVSFYQEKLVECGFEVLELLSDLEDEPIHNKTERILFVAKRK